MLQVHIMLKIVLRFVSLSCLKYRSHLTGNAKTMVFLKNTALKIQLMNKFANIGDITVTDKVKEILCEFVKIIVVSGVVSL